MLVCWFRVESFLPQGRITIGGRRLEKMLVCWYRVEGSSLREGSPWVAGSNSDIGGAQEPGQFGSVMNGNRLAALLRLALNGNRLALLRLALPSACFPPARYKMSLRV
jgi:hypothetical protein